MGATNGVSILISQAIGAKDKKKTESLISTSFCVAVVFSLLVTVLLEAFLPGILKALNTPAETYDMAYSYLAIYILGYLAVYLYLYFTAVLRSFGNSMFQAVAMLVSTILNAILDPIFIHFIGFHGAAIATLLDRMSQEHLYLHQNSRAIDNPYRFPLDTTERWEADRFFALALEASPNNILEIDEKENLSAWTLLLNEGEQETAGILLEQLLSLIDILQGELPPQCAPLKAPHSFCYQSAQPGRPSINLQTKEQGALVAYAQTTPQAQQHIKFLRETECCGDEDLLRQFVRVFYYEPRGHKLACVPMLSTEITQGRGQ